MPDGLPELVEEAYYNPETPARFRLTASQAALLYASRPQVDPSSIILPQLPPLYPILPRPPLRPAVVFQPRVLTPPAWLANCSRVPSCQCDGCCFLRRLELADIDDSRSAEHSGVSHYEERAVVNGNSHARQADAAGLQQDSQVQGTAADGQVT